MKEIRLGNGDVAFVDDDCFDMVSCYKWQCLIKRTKSEVYKYAVVYAREGNKWCSTMMHRMVLGVPKGTLVDHKDGNGLNNCKNNLRPATHQQNMSNRRKFFGVTSKYKGVWRNKNKNRWETRIRVNGLRIYLGRYKEERQAAMAYNRAATKYYGEFALLNSIDP